MKVANAGDGELRVDGLTANVEENFIRAFDLGDAGLQLGDALVASGKLEDVVGVSTDVQLHIDFWKETKRMSVCVTMMKRKKITIIWSKKSIFDQISFFTARKNT